MKQKLILLLVFLGIISTGKGFLHQASAQNAWNGNIETGWYNNSKETFEITTAEELAGLASLVNNGNSFLNKTITLKNDLILNNIDNYENWKSNPSGKEWTAIGTAQKPFKGTFDGNKHTISGLYIKTYKQYNGLFGAVENANIQNTGLINFYINADQYNGGIAGYSSKSSFKNVYSRGTIVTSKSPYIGGLIGHAINSTLENVSSNISITAKNKTNDIGGLIGNNEKTDINNAYCIGTISATNSSSNIGGLIGYNVNSNIKCVYTACDILTNSASNGGFIGYLKGTNNIQYCYYNTDKYSRGIGKNDGNGQIDVKGKKSNELKKADTYINWDFTNIWAISKDKNDGYPYLLMEETDIPPIVYPDIIRVKEDGNDKKDGSSWANAITLTKAFEVINETSYDPEKHFQIWIANGDYHTQGKAFHIKNNVLVYGGFSGNDESETVANRIGSAENTILYGSNNNRVLIIYQKDNLLNVTIDGLTIKEGVAHDEVAGLTLNSGETTKYRGGGIFNANAKTILQHIIISDNIANNEPTTYVAKGGGIYNYSGNLTLNNCSVDNNTSTKVNNEGKGGGIYLDKETTNATIRQSAIYRNTAINNATNEFSGEGGGIYNMANVLHITDSEISKNIATTGTGNGLGGGIYHTSLFDPGKQKEITLNNSVITENTAFKNTDFAGYYTVKGFGGGIYLEDGSVTINECDLEKNTAAFANENEAIGGNGGAIYNVAGRLIVEASKVLENTATNANGFGYGGGISNSSEEEVKLFNTLIAKNAAGEQAFGGGFSNTVGKNVTFINVTIAGNTAGQEGVTKGAGIGGGSGVYNYQEGHITIENTIVWDNKEATGIVQYLDDGATHMSGYCFISGLENDPGQGDTIVLNGINRSADYPKFTDSQNYNYRLKAASPLRNLAHKEYIDDTSDTWNKPDKDLDNNERINRSLDLGAYECYPLNVTLTQSSEFGYDVPHSTEKYGIISPTAYEIDPNESFEFSLQIDTNIVYTVAVKVDGVEYLPNEAKIYTIPNITKDTHIDVQLTVEQYAVTLPAIDGVTTDPEAGTYHIAPGEEFVFSLELEDGYDQSAPIVKANETIITLTDELYRIPVSSNVIITIEDIKQNEYTVKIPQVTGISTNPGMGNHTIRYDSTFNFTVTKENGYENYNLLVTADQNYQIETVDAASGKYRITNIRHNIILSIAFTQKPIHTVTLQAINEIQTSPKTGQYTIEDGNSFKVTFAIPEKYQVADIDVELDGNFETYEHVVGNSYAYTLPGIKKNHTINIVKNKRYQVNLNKTEGVIFNPSSGIHRVGKYDDFSFTITLEKNYDQSKFKVYANNSVINPAKVKEGTYTYTLSSIQKDYNITIEGVKQNDDTGNEYMDGKIKIYSENKTLFIRTNDVALMTIYTINGQVYKQNNIPAGTTKVILPSGTYIIRVNDEIFKIII